jgi:hypothetical protein
MVADGGHGGCWNRQNNPEIDLGGADRTPVASRIDFIGSVKWLEDKPFGRREYDEMVRDLLAVPGAQRDTPLVAVSRCGSAKAYRLPRAGVQPTWYEHGSDEKAPPARIGV